MPARNRNGVTRVTKPSHSGRVPLEPDRTIRRRTTGTRTHTLLLAGRDRPGYPYGEGVALQVRSAVSHLNEVWAVDTAGAILHGARARARLGVDPRRRPLDVRRGPPHADGQAPARGLGPAAGADPPRRLHLRGLRRARTRSTAWGCSATSRRRTSAASASAPRPSTRWATPRARRDMEFDWADETLHAEYGRRWLKDLLERRGRGPGVVARRARALRAARRRPRRPATDAERARDRRGRRRARGSGHSARRANPGPSRSLISCTASKRPCARTSIVDVPTIGSNKHRRVQ